MATSRIKIEVDYKDSVARVGQLEMGFKELEQSATKSRRAIQKAVRDTNSVLAGSLKALSRERAALVETQSTLARNNEEYRKYQRQLDMLDKQIARLTDTRKREEKTLKNSANGLRQQIALIQQEMNNRKLSNTQYRLMQEEVERLEQKHAQLTNTVKAGTIAAFDQQIAALQREQREVATTTEEIERLEQQIVSLRNRKAELARGTRDATKAQEGMSSSAGAAGATVTEFGRTIGDAPFGLMGMANNLQQLSQQFVDLQAKSGGTREAIKSIMTTMAGPAGFVVAINIVTSALVAYNMRKDKAKQKTEEFNESLLLERDTLIVLNELYEEGADNIDARAKVMGALAAADDKYAEALDAIGIGEEKRNKLTEDYIRDSKLLREAEDKRNKLAEDNKETLERQLMTEQDIAAERERISKIFDPDEAFLEQSILDENIKKNNELKDILQQVADVTIEVDNAEKQLNKTLGTSDMDKFIEKLREFEKERDLSRALRGLEGSKAIEEEIRLLQDEYGRAVRKFGIDSVQAKEAMLARDEKRLELEEALYEEGVERAEKEEEAAQERVEKEAERKEQLKELNESLLDDLEAQFDEYGLIRLKQQEDQAIAEAKALGASVETLMNITKYYEGERKKIVDKVNEEIAENDKKVKEKALKENTKKLEEYFDKEIEMMKARTDKMSEMMSNFSNLLDELNNISDARFERQINQLKVQRDIIRSNDQLTKEDKEKQLTDIQAKENEIQTKRIKAERDMFTIKQTIAVAEMVMKQRSVAMEMMMLAQLATAKANLAISETGIDAAKSIGKLKMTLPDFIDSLGGPLGIATYALSIGGMIATVVSARRKAQAEIASLSNVPVSLGGSSGGSAVAAPAAPAFNVVGATAQNQLAEAIAGAEQKPLRAYVVSSDVTTAQEMDRKIIEGASI